MIDWLLGVEVSLSENGVCGVEMTDDGTAEGCACVCVCVCACENRSRKYCIKAETEHHAQTFS